MTTPPSFRKVNPADFAGAVHLRCGSATLPLSTVNEYGDITIGAAVSQLPGVAQVLIYGAQKFAIRVQADPEAAAARGLSLDDIRTAVVARQFLDAGRHARTGRSRTSRCRPPARWTRRPTTARSWWPGATARRSSSTSRAKSIDSVENDKIATWLNGERAIVLGDPEAARRQHRRGGRCRAGASCRRCGADPAVGRHAGR